MTRTRYGVEGYGKKVEADTDGLEYSLTALRR